MPVELQDEPELVEKYLNGDPELGVSDKDWSHDVAKVNGGSDSADNGRFEDASTNRSRGGTNTTPEEQYTADVESEEDVQTLLESANDVAEASTWAFAAEAAGSLGEFALDAFAPLVGGAVAAKTVADRFETPEDKVGYGSLAGGATALFLCTPLGQLCVASYVGYRVVKRGTALYQKHCTQS